MSSLHFNKHQEAWVDEQLKTQRKLGYIDALNEAIKIFDKLSEEEIMTKNPIILELQVLKGKYE